MTPTVTHVLEYDDNERLLVMTQVEGPSEFGASQVVAYNVPAWFGVWAEEAWRDRPARVPAWLTRLRRTLGIVG